MGSVRITIGSYSGNLVQPAFPDILREHVTLRALALRDLQDPIDDIKVSTA